MFIKKSTSQNRFGRKSNGNNFNHSRGSGSSAYFRKPRPSFRSDSRQNQGRRGGEKMDISKFIKEASDRTPEIVHQNVNSFADFKFCEQIQTNLKKRNYLAPTPVQDMAIGSIMEGRDLIGLANTGSGKTAAFLLPLINKVFYNKSEKVLIIAPTRELATQIESEMREFSWGMQIFSTVCVGGMPIFRQIGNLKRNPNFIIGTPGRLKDLADRRLIKFENFSNIVIDEIDRMLDMGFVDEISAILNQLPPKRQSLFFSATMPPKIRRLVENFLNNPVTVETKSNSAAANVDQNVVRVRDRAFKFDQLKEILSEDEYKKVLIFIETKHEVEKLRNSLVSGGFKAESIHGDKKQNQRLKALRAFKDDHVNILVATDVAARGLDIKDVSHVINYTIPQTYDDYIHRIGRTGRGMKKGKALTFVEARY